MEKETSPTILSVTFGLTTDDIDAIRNFSNKREPQVPWWLAGIFIILIAAIGIGIALLITKNRLPSRAPMTTEKWVRILAPPMVLVVSFPLVLMWQRATQRRIAHQQPGTFFAPRTVTISGEGYREKLKDSEFFHSWKAVSEIHDGGSYIFILLPENNAATPICVIPKNAFDDPAQADAFLERARAFRRAILAESVTA